MSFAVAVLLMAWPALAQQRVNGIDARDAIAGVRDGRGAGDIVARLKSTTPIFETPCKNRNPPDPTCYKAGGSH
jgi:hypothetical protein